MTKKKKRKKKSKSKYVALPSKSIAPALTRKEMRSKFPENLVNAFIKVKKTGFENKKVYKKFEKLRRKYLGKKADDKLETGKLIVLLSRATMDLFEKKKGPKGNGKAKTKKKKED